MGRVEWLAMFRRHRWFIVAWGGFIALVLAVAFDIFPILRGEIPWLTDRQKWFWFYIPPHLLGALLSTALVAGYLVIVLNLLRRAEQQDRDPHRHQRYPVALIACAFVAASLLPLALLTMEGRPLAHLYVRTVLYFNGGYTLANGMIDQLGTTLANWPAFIERYRSLYNVGSGFSGVALDPPGNVVLLAAVRELFKAFPSVADSFDSILRPLRCADLNLMAWDSSATASAWFQMLMPLWAALGIPLIYRLMRQISDVRRARWAVALYPLVPALSFFVPRFNTAYPLITLLMLLSVVRALQQTDTPRHAAFHSLVAGFCLSVGMFMNLSLLPLGLLAGLLLLSALFPLKTLTPQRVASVAVLLLSFGLGCVSVWIIYWGLSGISPLAIYQLGVYTHLALDRPYLTYLVVHPYEMFVFAGVPIAILSVMHWLRPSPFTSQTTPSKTLLPIVSRASLLFMLILVLSGVARGETGRVWLFLLPLWIVLAADMISRLQPRWRISLLSMQAICLLLIVGFWHNYLPDSNFEISPAPPPTDSPAIPMMLTFRQGQDAIGLTGVTTRSTTSGLDLDLYWHVDSAVRGPYVLSLVIIKPDGTPEPTRTWVPRDWGYPPSCWAPQRTFLERVAIPTANREGDWQFALSVLRYPTGEPMQVQQPDGSLTTYIGIAPVRYAIPNTATDANPKP